MSRDWIDWHSEYDSPGSSLARRLVAVQQYIHEAIDVISHGTDLREFGVISMCAGDGRDLLPVLAEHAHGKAARALLVELDPRLAERARMRAQELHRDRIEVVCGDAGTTTVYAGIAPAHLVLVCGVLGNISAGDGRSTVASLRELTAPGGLVVWTRGRDSTDEPASDSSSAVREWFRDEAFTERSFTAPSDARFRVGLNQLTAAGAKHYRPNVRMFTFADASPSRPQYRVIRAMPVPSTQAVTQAPPAPTARATPRRLLP